MSTSSSPSRRAVPRSTAGRPAERSLHERPPGPLPPGAARASSNQGGRAGAGRAVRTPTGTTRSGGPGPRPPSPASPAVPPGHRHQVSGTQVLLHLVNVPRAGLRACPVGRSSPASAPSWRAKKATALLGALVTPSGQNPNIRSPRAATPSQAALVASPPAGLGQVSVAQREEALQQPGVELRGNADNWSRCASDRNRTGTLQTLRPATGQRSPLLRVGFQSANAATRAPGSRRRRRPARRARRAARHIRRRAEGQ